MSVLLAGTVSSVARSGTRHWPVPKHWTARFSTPRGWYAGALCVHSHESGDWHIHNEPYANGFQFMLGTWLSVGGTVAGWITAPPREQLYRAYLVWKRDGGSWREWPNTSRVCGLT